MQYERVQTFFDDVDKEKWNVVVGGSNPKGKGYFITPTIIDRPQEDSRIVVEEPFGKYIVTTLYDTDPLKSVIKDRLSHFSPLVVTKRPFPRPIIPSTGLEHPYGPVT